jgi:hypothetical protein
MAITRHHNVTGTITKELLKAGDSRRVKRVSLANVEGTNAALVDLWIQKQYPKTTGGEAGLYGKFYFFKQLSIPADTSLMYDLSFNNNAGEFSLYIKLAAASGTPEVDVILY